ncbi:sodium:solute symporter family protein [Halococcus hamelinensis]|uniref:Sodium:pantothenate symporter n=1 Tax=Halococcus hamelinensis 100A6 TaxID=1132509 RepID=M0LUD5_9EURY|nr:sodium:solute symporter family protein [Halococcus hamelinensis]EMA36783.1 sodium:pantothenate symporter [Halococcus hamelinensis 100A6]
MSGLIQAVLQTNPSPDQVSLGWEIVVFTVVALLGIIGIGWYSSKQNVGADADDFFSAGKSLGFVVIALSVFADSYSGNSFLGYSAETYRSGAWFLVYPQFMIAGIIGALIIAPPLINLGKEWNYTSPIDYIEHRFDKRVAFLTLLFMIWGTFVQFTEQFFAMGYLGRVASGGIIPYQAVVVLFGLVILVYVGLGGFRGTALSAAVQGVLMLMALCLMLVVVGHFGGATSQIDTVWQTAPEKLTLPSASTMSNWYGLVLLILFGLPTYIHIQQFYLSVKDAKDLRSTFRVQAPIFLLAATILWGIGLLGAGIFPGLSESGSEQLIPYLIGSFANTGGGTLLPSLISLGIIMATLSTAGATVMVLSMAIAKDMYKRFINAEASDERVINASRLALAGFLVFALVLSFTPNLTIWAWTQLKFEFLLQATPVFIFGLYLSRVKSDFAVAGMILGCAVAVGLYVFGAGEIFGLNAGIVGFVVNSLVLVGGSYLTGETAETERARDILEYNSIEYPNGNNRKGVKYVLPGQKKSFWVGLVVVLALIVPWYAPDSWNAQAAFGLPIWTWVILGAMILETAFVLYGTMIWRERPVDERSTNTGVSRGIETED